MIEQKIRQSLLIERTIPDYVVEEFPLFVDFARQYYRWMETDGNTVDQINKILANKDIDTVTSAEHEYFILDTFMQSVPKSINVNYAQLLHHIKKFYSEKGTDASIKTFFYLLSEARRPNVIYVVFEDVEDLLVGETIRGTSSGAMGTVIRATRISPSSPLVSLSLQYSTDAAYRSRSFTSSDSIKLDDGTVLQLRIEDFTPTIFYPKEHILRTSDGVYGNDYRCRIKLPMGSYRNFENLPFETTSGSKGRIDKQSYSVATENGFDYYDLTLSFSTRRQWKNSEKIFINGEEILLATIITGVEIVNGGLGYVPGDRFPVVNTEGVRIGDVIVETIKRGDIDRITIINGGNNYRVGDEFQFKYSTGFYGGGYVTRVISGIISELKVTHSNRNSAEYPEIVFANGNNSASLHALGDNVGSLVDVYVDTVGVDVDLSITATIDDKPNPLQKANLRFQVGTLYQTKRTFRGESGQLSSYYRIQDSFYWQDFSYVLKFNASVNFEEHFELFKKTVHPAGTRVFFEMRKTEDASSMDLAIGVTGEQFLRREDASYRKISDVQYQPISTGKRFKDWNPFQTYMYGINAREMNKSAVFDNTLFFPSDGMTINRLSDMYSSHKYTCSFEFHPIYHVTQD